MIENEAVKIEKVVERYCLAANGKKLTPNFIAKEFGYSKTRAFQILKKPDADQYIADLYLKRLYGVPLKATIYRRDDGSFAFAYEIRKFTGISNSACHNRIMNWLDTGNCDELYSPVNLKKGPVKGKIYKPRRISEGQRRKIESVSVGSWEQANL